MDTSTLIGTDTQNVQNAIDAIVSRWEAPSDAHERFRRWATGLATALAPETENFTELVSQLKAEFRSLHAQLAATLVEFGHVDEGLVSRRSFVAHLLDRVEPHARSGTSGRHSFVRTAA